MEGDVAVKGDVAAEVLESPTSATEPVRAADDTAPVASTTPLFQELNVSSKTTPKGLMRAIVGAFNKGERAVDLLLIDPRYKHLILFATALVPDAFQSSAQLLPRRRDRRLRVRVVQHFRPEEDENPEVFRVAQQTNVTKLGGAMKNIVVDIAGNNLMRTVRLQFQGPTAASNAILAMETAGRLAYRELMWHAQYVEEQASTPASDGDEGAPPEQAKNMVSIVVTVNTA